MVLSAWVPGPYKKRNEKSRQKRSPVNIPDHYLTIYLLNKSKDANLWQTYSQETPDIVQQNFAVIERNNDCELITGESDDANSVPRDVHFVLSIKLVDFLLTVLKCSSQRRESI